MESNKELTDDGKKKYADIKIQRIFHLDSQRTQLVLSRFQILATISGLATAFAGFILASTDNVHNICLAVVAITVLLSAMSLSLFIYLFNGKKYIDYLSKKIAEAPNLSIGEKSKILEPKLSAEWPEIILFFLIVGIYLLVLSNLKLENIAMSF